MESIELPVEPRDAAGKGASRRLRRSRRIPAVVYGHTTPLAVTVDAREFRGAFRRITENTVVQLTLPEGVHEVLVKDFQQDNLSGQIVHLDFYEFERGKALKTRVPIQLTGAAVGVKEGGTIIINTRKKPDEFEFSSKFRVAAVDAAGISIARGLLVSGIPALNTPMLGVIARVTDQVSLASIEEVIKQQWKGAAGEANAAAAREAYDRTEVNR